MVISEIYTNAKLLFSAKNRKVCFAMLFIDLNTTTVVLFD